MASITLYDVAPGILLSFEESLRRYAMNTFARDQVIVRPNSKVNRVGDGWMEIEGEGKVPFGLLVWSTGLEPNPLIKSMKGVSKDPRSSSCVPFPRRRPSCLLARAADADRDPLPPPPGFTPTTSSASLARRAARSRTSSPSATTLSSRTATACRPPPRLPRRRRPSSPTTSTRSPRAAPSSRSSSAPRARWSTSARGAP